MIFFIPENYTSLINPLLRECEKGVKVGALQMLVFRHPRLRDPVANEDERGILSNAIHLIL